MNDLVTKLNIIKWFLLSPFTAIPPSNYAIYRSFYKESKYKKKYAVQITRHHINYIKYMKGCNWNGMNWSDYLESVCGWELDKKMFDMDRFK